MDTMTSRKKRKKRSKVAAIRRCLPLLVAAALIMGASTLEAASKRDRSATALIAGTVFQSSGHLLRGAKVEVVAQDDAKTKHRAVSDLRGDFAIRVSAGRRTYIVTATAKGFQPQQKLIEVYEDEKVRTNLILSPVESGSKK